QEDGAVAQPGPLRLLLAGQPFEVFEAVVVVDVHDGAPREGSSMPTPSGRSYKAPELFWFRITLNFAAGGAAPAAVASLAERVLAMISVAKWKMILFTTIALGATAGLAAGIARAVGPKPGAQAPRLNARPSSPGPMTRPPTKGRSPGRS